MEKEISQQALTPPDPFAHTQSLNHQDAFGVKTHAKGHMVTYGEKKFDRLTYTTVGYVINALLSVGAVWWAERTHGGQKAMDNFRNWSEKKLTFVKPDTAKMLATKSFFLAGGFLVMPPMKWLEDKKVELVKKWDRKHYGAVAETSPEITKSHEDLENAPKQNWKSILSSRILALVPFYTGYWLLWDKKSPLSKATGEKVFVDRPIISASRGIGKGWAKLTGNKAAEEAITALNKTHAGEILNPKEAAKLGINPDPTHSVMPYYVISEAITSGMVAWGVYVLTRVLGPIMGKKAAPSGKYKKEEDQATPISTSTVHTISSDEPQAKKEDRPQTTIDAAKIEHHAAVTQHSPQATL